MKILLCEGRCNPSIRDIDARIHAARRTHLLDSDNAPAMRRALPTQLYRGQFYTPHVQSLRDHLFRCEACGCIRAFGTEPAQPW